MAIDLPADDQIGKTIPQMSWQFAECANGLGYAFTRFKPADRKQDETLGVELKSAGEKARKRPVQVASLQRERKDRRVASEFRCSNAATLKIVPRRLHFR